MHVSFRRRVFVGITALALVALVHGPAAAAPKPRPTQTTAPNCGSLTLYKTSGGAWKCTFGDDFNSFDTKKWVVQQTSTSGYQNGGECFVANSKNVSVANGELSLTVRKEAAPFTCSSPYGNYQTQYTAGMVSTWGKFSQTYGRFEVRAKFPAATVAGLHSALWLWPVNATKYGAWPLSGEIDIAEAYSQYPDRVIPYVHYDSDPLDKTVTNNYCMVSDVSAYHTYTAEWTPTNIKVMYDGVTCIDHTIDSLTLAGAAPFDQPFIMALTQALGQQTNSFSPTSTPLPATTKVDYVRVWS